MAVIRPRPTSVGLALALAVGTAVATCAGADQIIDAIREVRPDHSGAVHVEDVHLDTGLAKVVLTDGVLVPGTPVGGRPVELAFVGRGRIELDPPDRIEADQLELFTGSRRLDERFGRAVFVIARDAAVDELLERPAADDGEHREAVDLLGEWLAGPERRRLDLEARIFADAVGDRLVGDTFCGVFDGDVLGRFLYVVDPLEREQVTLGRFVRPELTGRQRRDVGRRLERAHRRGKLIGLEIADLGIWDTWVSAELIGGDGEPTPGSRGVEPVHYELAIRLTGPDLELEGRARISMRTVVDGLHSIAFELHPDLEPIRVTDGQDRELAWHRSRGELVAVLRRPVGGDAPLEVVIDYRGRPVEIGPDGVSVLRTTTGWYPHAGTVDRATYAVTARWPEGFDLIAPGQLERLVGAARGERALRWRVPLPSVGTSFEIGRFTTLRGRAGEVEIDVAVDRLGADADPELTEAMLATVADTVAYFEGLYGPYPLNRLQVVTSPRGFSQGLLGLVTLSTGSVVDWDVWGALLGLQDRRSMIAHEVAHQWWGNLVGWQSYRDQWIPEAMANVAALSWQRHRLDAASGIAGAGPTARWQEELLRTTETGRTVESLGPLVLGPRLDSSISDRAFTAIAYKKGALVLNTLAELIGEKAFLGGLREAVRLTRGGTLSTDELVAVMTTASGSDLTGFTRAFIEGTGVPDIDYSTTFEARPGGDWTVVGRVHHRATGATDYRVTVTADGTLDLRRRTELDDRGSAATLGVPFRIGFVTDRSTAADARRLAGGRVRLAPGDDSFRIGTNVRPEIFWLDRGAEVFAIFLNADRRPRLAAYRRGLELEVVGGDAVVRRTYRDALDAPVLVVPAGWEDAVWAGDPELQADSLDARIRLALARLALDDGELDAAAVELEHARELIRGRDRWLLDRELLVAESRLNLLSGDPKSAFRELRDRVLGDRPVSSPETWGLLAIAARQVGDTEVFDRARRRARELGVELGPLAADAVQ